MKVAVIAHVSSRRYGKTAALAALVDAMLTKLAAEASDVVIAATDDALHAGAGTGIVFVSGNGRAIRIPPGDFQADLSSDLSSDLSRPA